MNDPPSIVAISDQEINEDTELVLEIIASDPEGDNLTYSASASEEQTSINVVDSQVTILPPGNYYGDIIITLSVDDGELNNNQSFTLTVLPVNDPPYIEFIADTAITEGGSFVYPLVSGDIDGDDIYYVVGTNGDASTDVSENILTVIPDQLFNGDLHVNIIVSDGQYEIAENFVITILSVNDPPSIVAISDQEINEDTELILELITSDPDGDDLTFTTDNTGNASINITDNQLSLLPALNFNGEIIATIIVSDGELLDSTKFSVNVLPINDPPELIDQIQDIIVLESSEDIEIQLSDIFYDVENGSNLAYSISENVEGLNVNIVDTVLTLSFVEGVSGSGTVEITASDNIDRATVSISFNVAITPVNDPPVADSNAVVKLLFIIHHSLESTSKLDKASCIALILPILLSSPEATVPPGQSSALSPSEPSKPSQSVSIVSP